MLDARYSIPPERRRTRLDSAGETADKSARRMADKARYSAQDRRLLRRIMVLYLDAQYRGDFR